MAHDVAKIENCGLKFFRLRFSNGQPNHLAKIIACIISGPVQSKPSEDVDPLDFPSQPSSL
jgi:hypothetical protein